MKTSHLPISPSKTLLRFANRIAILGTGPVLDAPCGYGRNAVALASLGCTVVGIDNDPQRLSALEQSKGTYISTDSLTGRCGQIATVCAELRPDRWLFAPSSFSAIICVHFEMIDILPCLILSLQKGGYIYLETVGGHGQNFRALPKIGELRNLLGRDTEFQYYNERQVGPAEFNSVCVTLFAQKR